MNSMLLCGRSRTACAFALLVSVLGCEDSNGSENATVMDIPTSTTEPTDSAPAPSVSEEPSRPAGEGPGGVAAGGQSGMGGGATDGPDACAATAYDHSWEFGAIFEGWTISSYSTPSLIPMASAPAAALELSAADAGGAELGDAAAPDAAGPAPSPDAAIPVVDAGDSGTSEPPAAETGVGTLMELDTTEGAPDSPNGALKLTIPFDGPGQLLLLGNVFNTALNFEGTLVTAQIKLGSGVITSPADSAYANLVLKATDSWVYFAGPAAVLDPSAGWVELTLDPDAPSSSALSAGFTACEIMEVDIEIHTGDSGTFTEGIVYVDQIAVAPKP